MHLTLHLTARCNLRCRYCYAAPHAGGDMTPEVLRAAIDMAVAMNQRERPGLSLGIVFFGGEPLLRRDLIHQALAWCREIETSTGQLFHYKITTNGTLLDEEFLTSPETRDVFVAMSHDGLRESHDAHRVDAAGQGTFDRLEPVIDRLLARRPYAPVLLVTNPDTVQYFANSVRYLHRRGFTYLITTPNYGAEWDERSLAELRRQYQSLGGWYYEAMMREEKFYFSPFEVKIGSHVRPGSCKAERCELGRTQISVAPNGKLYPCVQFVGDGTDDEYAIGDVFSGIDAEARWRLYAANGEEKESCAECAIRDRCNHYCGCLNRQATGRIDRVSPVLCAHERIVIPIADRVAERLFKKRNALFIHKHYNELYPIVSLLEDTSRARADMR
ncbi:MAG TPA: radical SAM protein [Armatimonadota bacterium]|nr:radical SAM protein [Armatimonadota bacterium]